MNRQIIAAALVWGLLVSSPVKAARLDSWKRGEEVFAAKKIAPKKISWPVNTGLVTASGLATGGLALWADKKWFRNPGEKAGRLFPVAAGIGIAASGTHALLRDKTGWAGSAAVAIAGTGAITGAFLAVEHLIRARHFCGQHVIFGIGFGMGAALSAVSIGIYELGRASLKTLVPVLV